MNEPSMSIDELSSSGSNNNITSEGNLEASRDGKPSDCSDDRLAASLHLRDGVGLDVLNIALEDIFGGSEIDAGTEGSSRPGQNDDPHRFIGVEFLECLSEVSHHGASERV